MTEQEDKTPLWKYVTKFDKVGGGGNVRFTCNFCQVTYNGSYPRVKAHLMKISGIGIKACPKVTPQHLAEMRKLVDEAELRLKNSQPTQIPLPSSSKTRTFSSSASTTTKRRKDVDDSPLEACFNFEAREEIDGEIARMFYSGGLPFHLARNPHYVGAFSKAANSKRLSGYKPPGYNSLRTTLLQKERANIERQLEPTKASWKEKGLSIVSDGWTDAQRRPIINFMAASESGPMFLKAINCQGEYKDKYFIAALIREVILEVGAQNVVQVITDNAPVCKGAGLIIEGQFPNIFWTPCVVHTLNLALKNICAAKNSEANAEAYGECSWITEIIGDVMVIKNFIMNHSMRLAMFNQHSPLKMLSVAETRFASSIIMLKRFTQIKQGLQSMVISAQWSSYREDDVGRAANVKEKILDDLWWDNIAYILSFTDPIYDMLRKADTDKPSLHLVYDMWDSMIENVKLAIYRHEGKREYEDSTFYSVVHRILVDRWGKSNTPLHCLAHSLNPRYYSQEWLQASPNRVPPHKDEEISTERQKCFERYFPNVEERRLVINEYAKFSCTLREFANNDSMNMRGQLDPDCWWGSCGSPAPLLQTLALKLLGQPCSSSCCERNWSTYSFINSLKRNKITPQRGEDLVFVHSNLRLLSRKSSEYHEGDSKMWDIGGDSFDTMEGAGILEIADLSLDEPDLEDALLKDGNEDTNEGIGDI